jgi:hypothetical protein
MELEDLVRFINTIWHIEDAWRHPEIAKVFRIDRNTAKYYLMKAVNLGMLIRVVHERNVWYIHSTHLNRFPDYENIGVKIEYRKRKVDEEKKHENPKH